MLYALWSGETAKVTLLLERGAKMPRRVSLLGGEFTVSPLELAIFQRDLPMVRLSDRPGSRCQRAQRDGRDAPDAGRL